jgi:hypothetical protein
MLQQKAKQLRFHSRKPSIPCAYSGGNNWMLKNKDTQPFDFPLSIFILSPVIPKLFEFQCRNFATHQPAFFCWNFWHFGKGKFWQFWKENFDSLERKILTVWKGKFWQFGKEDFDSLERKILTVWKGKFWQLGKEDFDSLERKILTVWKGKFWQFRESINVSRHSLRMTGMIPTNKLII